jgi:hypothetical protein
MQMVATTHEVKLREKMQLGGKGQGVQVPQNERLFPGVVPRNSAGLPLKRLDECGGEMTTGQYSSVFTE